MFHGWVDVNDEFDVIYVNSTSCNVRCDENLDVSLTECSEVAVALGLRQVSVQIDCRNTCVGQGLGKLLGVVLGAHEQDATAGTRSELVDKVLLGIVAASFKHVVSHLGNGGVSLVNRVENFVVEELVNQFVHAII